MEINLKKFGKILGTRSLGIIIRDEIMKHLEKEKDVKINLNDIDMITQSFADELFGKLFIKIGENDFKKRIQITTKNEDIASIINFVIFNRKNAHPQSHQAT